MILAIDVHYRDDAAYCIGVLFEWADMSPRQIIREVVSPVQPYIPGEFYRRELPCLLQIISHTDIRSIDAIIVDAHVYLDDAMTHGLGGRLWDALSGHVPVIGVAKTSFHSNAQTTVAVLRGDSKQPLYVSAIGMDKAAAAALIQKMHGDYRMPDMLKKLDQLTRQ